MCLTVLWEKQNVDKVWVCTRVQPTCHSTWRPDVDSQGDEGYIGWFLKEKRECQAVFDIFDIRFVSWPRDNLTIPVLLCLTRG